MAASHYRCGPGGGRRRSAAVGRHHGVSAARADRPRCGESSAASSVRHRGLCGLPEQGVGERQGVGGGVMAQDVHGGDRAVDRGVDLVRLQGRLAGLAEQPRGQVSIGEAGDPGRPAGWPDRGGGCGRSSVAPRRRGAGPVAARPAATSCSASSGLPWARSAIRAVRASGSAAPVSDWTTPWVSARVRGGKREVGGAWQVGEGVDQLPRFAVDGRVASAHGQQWSADGRAGRPKQVAEQVAGGGVHPVQVLDDQPHEPVVPERLDGGGVPGEQPEPIDLALRALPQEGQMLARSLA